MADRYRVRCGGADLPAPGRAWRAVSPIDLELGPGRRDVHLRVERLNRDLGIELPDVAIDLIELAAYVYAADQGVSRGGTKEFEYGLRWRRHFRFEVPVRCPAVWQRPDVVHTLAETLGFLSDDDYEFAFEAHPEPVPLETYLFDAYTDPVDHGYEEVALFSGGLDSLAGAVREILVGGRRVVLVSHRPVSTIHARQRELVAALGQRLADRHLGRLRPLHVGLTVNKGKRLSREYSQRSRSFLFAAIAAVVARSCGLRRIRYYENGVTSLNLPLSPQVLGGRASRTTHPRTLAGFARLLGLLFDGPFAVENPFGTDTKTDLLANLRTAGGAPLAALTCSCAHTRTGTPDRPHCGQCTQCQDRRIAALAAGLTDADDPPWRYALDVLTAPRTGVALILAERLHGTALRIARMQSAEEFVASYPEAVRALGFDGVRPADGAARLFAMSQRHAGQVCRALADAVARSAEVLVYRRLAPNCLLCIAGGGSPAAVVRTDDRSDPPPQPMPNQLVLDRSRFAALWGDAPPCVLGNTREFAILERLNRHPGRYVTYDALRDDVWGGERVERNTVQRHVSNLRARIRRAEWDGVEIDGSQQGNYRLVLPALAPSRHSA